MRGRSFWSIGTAQEGKVKRKEERYCKGVKIRGG
jgi:hypothetical protein